jgi:hypothetical protein
VGPGWVVASTNGRVDWAAGREGACGRHWLSPSAQVRFCCSARIYAFIRSGNNRYPAEQMRLSGPLPTDRWQLDSNRTQPLPPDPDNATHPYPVELILPAWTVASDIDFRRWLFGYGADVVIEGAQELRMEHAARLLRSGEHSVTGVIFSCGFTDVSHFYRTFRHRFGAAPGVWMRGGRR